MSKSVVVFLDSSFAIAVVVDESGATVGILAWAVSVDTGGAADIVAHEGEWTSVGVRLAIYIWSSICVTVVISVTVVVSVTVRIGVRIVRFHIRVVVSVVVVVGCWHCAVRPCIVVCVVVSVVVRIVRIIVRSRTWVWVIIVAPSACSTICSYIITTRPAWCEPLEVQRVCA